MMNMMLASAVVAVMLSIPSQVAGHAAMTWPPSNRQGSSMEHAGDCATSDCRWFSNIVNIPGIATNNASEFRTYNVGDASGSPSDWSRGNPWRAPGSAPVRGSGCGVAGGANIVLFNGGISPPMIPQGMDGTLLPDQQPYEWAAGSIQEVAFALLANHGGGYSYRLCPIGEDGDVSDVTEECFQKLPLDFAGSQQWIQFGQVVPGQPRYELPPMQILSEGTTPPGSQWARNPIPACDLCAQTSCGFNLLNPNWTEPSGQMAWGTEKVEYYGGDAWIDQTHCGVVCAGEALRSNYAQNGSRTNGELCPPGATQFMEPLPGLSGFTVNHTYPDRSVTAYSIVDRVIIPADLPPARYLLSWRWDCEQSPQVWQNCADIQITKPDSDDINMNKQEVKLAGHDQSYKRQPNLWETPEEMIM